MDILGHALWTTAAAAGARRRLGCQVHLGWAAFWGIFPDVFSFAIPAIVRIWWYATGTTHSLMPQANSAQHFQFVWQLYHCSHSLVVFAVVFGVVWGLAGRPVLELLGWPLHILIDIPTHRGIFAIHFLWPLSSYGVQGIRWESPWFMGMNYGLLVLVFGGMWMRNRRRDRLSLSIQATARRSRPASDEKERVIPDVLANATEGSETVRKH